MAANAGAGTMPVSIPPATLATAWRGGVAEALYRGHVAVVDSSGTTVSALGDPDAAAPLRSCAKPLQALPFVEMAMDAVAATEAELALACASHNGEDEHVATARGLLVRAGVSESELECGPQLPTDEATGRRLLASGGVPLPVHNNCSGKHAAMLATCVVKGWPRAGYIDRDHPVQQAVTATLSRHLELDLDAVPWGIDGCGLPTFGVPLSALARAFAGAQRGDAGFRRCQDAMTAHPFLVAGTGRFDTALLACCGATLSAKIGGAALWVAVVRDLGTAVAVKLEGGAGEAVPPVAIAVLRQLGALPDPLPEPLRRHAEPVLRNWAGDAVGRIEASVGAL